MSASVVVPFKATSIASKAHQMVQTTSYEQLVVNCAQEILCEMTEVYEHDCPIDVEKAGMRETLIEKMCVKFEVNSETVLDDICRAITKIEQQQLCHQPFIPKVVAL